MKASDVVDHLSCCFVLPCSLQLYGFSSDRKMSCCVMREGDKLAVYNKGAAEWVLKRCTHQMTAEVGC